MRLLSQCVNFNLPVQMKVCVCGEVGGLLKACPVLPHKNSGSSSPRSYRHHGNAFAIKKTLNLFFPEKLIIKTITSHLQPLQIWHIAAACRRVRKAPVGLPSKNPKSTPLKSFWLRAPKILLVFDPNPGGEVRHSSSLHSAIACKNDAKERGCCVNQTLQRKHAHTKGLGSKAGHTQLYFLPLASCAMLGRKRLGQEHRKN